RGPAVPPARPSAPRPAPPAGRRRRACPRAYRPARAASRDRSPATPLELADTLAGTLRSEEHTSELQSRVELVCRLLLEKKKETTHRTDRKTSNSLNILRGPSERTMHA